VLLTYGIFCFWVFIIGANLLSSPIFCCLINIGQPYALNVSVCLGIAFQRAHYTYCIGKEFDCCFNVFFCFEGNV
jgi:hypothetical protein